MIEDEFFAAVHLVRHRGSRERFVYQPSRSPASPTELQESQRQRGLVTIDPDNDLLHLIGRSSDEEAT